MRDAILRSAVVALALGCACHAAKPAISKPMTPTVSATADAAADREAADDDAGADAEVAAETDDTTRGPCPSGMVLVAGKVCVDRYEASLVETTPDGGERPYPHYLTVDGHDVRAVSVPGTFPQGFISRVQADGACAASHKRLCTHDEWRVACRGPENTTFPYGNTRQAGTCHDTGKSAVLAVFGANAVMMSNAILASGRHVKKTAPTRAPTSTKKATPPKKAGTKKHATKKPLPKKHVAAPASVRPEAIDLSVWNRLNDPALGQVDGALARTGEHPACVNGWGVYDMVGNIHEWVADGEANGMFAGGYYLDTTINGDGCEYRTTAHATTYHDYSTGFRCCADPEGDLE